MLLSLALLVTCVVQGQPIAKAIILAFMILPVIAFFIESACRRAVITDEGIIVIKAQEHRTQERNRKAAIDRLRELILSAMVERKPRKQTKPSRRSVQRRIDSKRHRGGLKQTRGNTSDD